MHQEADLADGYEFLNMLPCLILNLFSSRLCVSIKGRQALRPPVVGVKVSDFVKAVLKFAKKRLGHVVVILGFTAFVEEAQPDDEHQQEEKVGHEAAEVRGLLLRIHVFLAQESFLLCKNSLQVGVFVENVDVGLELAPADTLQIAVFAPFIVI